MFPSCQGPCFSLKFLAFLKTLFSTIKISDFWKTNWISGGSNLERRILHKLWPEELLKTAEKVILNKQFFKSFQLSLKFNILDFQPLESGFNPSTPSSH